MKKKYIAFFLLLMLPVISICAENRTALVIGNSDYRYVAKLRNPKNDAADISHVLKVLGFEVTTLVDAGQMAMEEAVLEFTRSLRSGGTGLFFYAGHGVQYDGENFLLPVDADIESDFQLRYKAVSANFVLDAMEAAGNSLNMVFLDACRDNPLPSGVRSTGRGLSVVSAPKGSIVVYSTAPGDVAEDGAGRNGTFTGALLKYLSTPDIEMKRMLDSVFMDVAVTTREKQTPWLHSSFYGEFYFVQAQKTNDLLRPVGETYCEVFVNTEPMDATVFINGENKGQSPAYIENLPLYSEIEIEAVSGNLYASEIMTFDSEGLHEVSLELEMQRGNLIIISPVRDIDVRLNGESMGPVGAGLFRDISIGVHELVLISKGNFWKGTVQIEKGSTTRIKAEPYEVGTIDYSIPPGARGVLTGKEFNKEITGSGKIENLLTGFYTASFRGGDYIEKKIDFKIRKGETYDLKVSLKHRQLLEMVLVEAGSFLMGSISGGEDEEPVHSVSITKDFYISKYEIAHYQFIEFLNSSGVTANGTFRGVELIDMDDSDCAIGYGSKFYFKKSSRAEDDKTPAIEVTWYGGIEYCNWLSEQEGLTPCYTMSGRSVRCDFQAEGYRLPTEAEWEYAARGGNKSRGYTYAGSNSLGIVGWHSGNTGAKTSLVGQKDNNELGLYDMSGNVWEWCWDWYDSRYYSKSSSSDPTGPSRGKERVKRGGSWYNPEDSLRAANRSSSPPADSGNARGFRPVRNTE
jgi:formylglycine-generating enzyme